MARSAVAWRDLVLPALYLLTAQSLEIAVRPSVSSGTVAEVLLLLSCALDSVRRPVEAHHAVWNLVCWASALVIVVPNPLQSSAGAWCFIARLVRMLWVGVAGNTGGS